MLKIIFQGQPFFAIKDPEVKSQVAWIAYGDLSTRASPLPSCLQGTPVTATPAISLFLPLDPAPPGAHGRLEVFSFCQPQHRLT